MLKKRDDQSNGNTTKVATSKNGADKKATNGKKAQLEEKITVVNAKKRKLEKMQLDLEQSDEEEEDNIAEHIYR